MDWQSPPRSLGLPEGEVHLWRASLALAGEERNALQRLLSPDEIERVERFVFPRHRDRFIAGRGLLRRIIARYLDRDPAGLRFSYGRNGKPKLASEPGGPFSLSFNVSHSREMVLFALAVGRYVGVDIEWMRTDIEGEKLAKRFFSAAESEALLSIPETEQVEAFYQCWTRKEAFIKAVGEGLAIPLDRFEVSLGRGVPAALLAVDGNREEASRWSLEEVRPAPGYAAALAVEGKIDRMRCFECPTGGEN